MTISAQKYVCSECSGSSELKQEVFDLKKESETCSYCRKRRSCISIESLADAVDDNYRGHYEECSDGQFPSEIVSDLLGLDQAAGKLDFDIVDILYNRELYSSFKGVDPLYDENMTYCTLSEKYPPIIDGREHKELWDNFCNRIKHRTRYFNNQVIVLLNGIFIGLDKIIYSENKSPIRSLDPNDSEAVFYRARHASNAQERIKICCHPSQELNSPPAQKATGGRMNPVGVSVFYAAFDRETCIAELRLPVGEEVISGQFKLERAITVLDLTVLDNIDTENSINNIAQSPAINNDVDTYEDRLAFLRQFSKEISKPISPYNKPYKEQLDYMPTQALAEYLAHHYKPKIDAVIYSSTQSNGKGKNIVFLNRHGRVIDIESPENGKYKGLWMDDKYCISLCGPPRRFDSTPPWDDCVNLTFAENDELYDDKYLSFIEDSLKLHKISAINYEVKSFDVTFKNLANS